MVFSKQIFIVLTVHPGNQEAIDEVNINCELLKEEIIIAASIACDI